MVQCVYLDIWLFDYTVVLVDEQLVCILHLSRALVLQRIKLRSVQTRLYIQLLSGKIGYFKNVFTSAPIIFADT